MSTAVSDEARMLGAAAIETQLAEAEAAGAARASGTDARLVRLAGDGDELAFEAIVSRYRDGLLRYAQRIVGAGPAEDAVQQALVNAWRALHSGCEVRSLRPWLFTIVHRSSLELLRGEGTPCAPLASSLAGGPSPEEQAELSGRAQTMLSAIAELPAAERRALVTTSVQGRSARDTAADLGVSESAVRQLVFRARARVRERTAGALSALPFPALAAWLRAHAGGAAARAVRGGATGRAGGAGTPSAGGAGGAGSGAGTSALAPAAAKLAAVVAIGAAVATPAVVVPAGSADHGPAMTRGAGSSDAAGGRMSPAHITAPPTGLRARAGKPRASGDAAGPDAPSAQAPADGTRTDTGAGVGSARSGAPGGAGGDGGANGTAHSAGSGAGTATGAAETVAGAAGGVAVGVTSAGVNAVGTLTGTAGEALGAVSTTVSSTVPAAGPAAETVTHTVEAAAGAGAGAVTETGKQLHGLAERLLPAG